jgi:hypothetical protein
MSLQARVSRVDDYAGELTQALEKLEIEQGRGALDRDQQADFLVDLRKAVELRDLRPMRNRALFDLLLAALTLLAALLLPKGLGFRHPALLVLLALCTLSLCMAGWRISLYLRRRRHDQAWLNSLDAAVDSGGTIFDAR